MSQAYYHKTINAFLEEDTNSILGKLNKAGTSFAKQWTITTTSWDSEIGILKSELTELVNIQSQARDWSILIEYEIPRLLTRIDAVIIADDIVFVIEFKHDRKVFAHADLMQVEDYAMDLADFHLESKNRKIVPILLAPLAPKEVSEFIPDNTTNIQPTIKVNSQSLAESLLEVYKLLHGYSTPIDAQKWENSQYSPTPTIIQAAQALFAGQKVEAISKHGADATNISETTNYLIEVINDARKRGKKIICFVTGVPGAGKTLVGLNIIHKEEFIEKNQSSTAYFSGNGPLIRVLREALTRDEWQRSKLRSIDNKATKSKKAIEQKIKAKIQDLHKFIKDGLTGNAKPFERIVVFDEAQRCWDASHFTNQSKRNGSRSANPIDPKGKSEAEVLFEIMDSHSDWSVIIALVGGGQEINTGEAGIGEWGRVLKEKYSHWQIYISPELLEGDPSTAGNKLFDKVPSNLGIETDRSLHLSISQRSFRANNLNEWVNAVLSNDANAANNLYQSITRNYPIYITRDLQKAKNWLKSVRRGTRRSGLIASSGALRLRSYGINTKEDIDEAYWFLNDEADVRSSSFLESVATEFGIQGLEIDWVGICWDIDLRRKDDAWDFKNFSGTKWMMVNKTSDQQYILNTYRVLLTRAREGMVIWIPEGDAQDVTRLPEYYNEVYNYLKSCGVVNLP